jgi:hypothetical protein
LSLLALPTILSGWSDLARVGLALAGAFAASMLQVFGLPLSQAVSRPVEYAGLAEQPGLRG